MGEGVKVPRPEVLDEKACWELLKTMARGRLAVLVNGRPDLFPVNFRVDRQTLLFRTGDGTKLAALEADPHVAFEADNVDRDETVAWSVVIHGTAEEAQDSEELTGTVADLYPWQGVGQHHLVRVRPEEISGRRFRLPASARVEASLDDAMRAGLE